MSRRGFLVLEEGADMRTMNDLWLLTVTEAAELLKVHHRTVRRLIGTGVVPAVKIGGSVRIPADRLREQLGLVVEPDRHPGPVAVAGGRPTIEEVRGSERR